MSGRCDECGEIGDVYCDGCLSPQDEARRLRRRVATLESRLARVLAFATDQRRPFRKYQSGWSHFDPAPRGRVWSKRTPAASQAEPDPQS